MSEALSKQQATELLLQLVAAYGLRWGPSVPASAYEDLRRVSEVLSADEKRRALGLATRYHAGVDRRSDG